MPTLQEERFADLSAMVALHLEHGLNFPSCYNSPNFHSSEEPEAVATRRTKAIIDIWNEFSPVTPAKLPRIKERMAATHVMSTTKISHFFQTLASDLATMKKQVKTAKTSTKTAKTTKTTMPKPTAAESHDEEDEEDDDEVPEVPDPTMPAATATTTSTSTTPSSAPPAATSTSSADSSATEVVKAMVAGCISAAKEDELRLLDTLNDTWYPVLAPVIAADPRAAQFIGPNRNPATLPVRELTFRAILYHQDVSAWKVVIFGQSPFPRRESATGVACMDGAVRTWRDVKTPTLRNMMKGILVHGGHMTVDQKPDVMRERLRTLNILDPLNWTQCTIEQGVLWLNTSLTMVPNEDLAPHTSFWSQVMHEIIRHIFAAKAAKAGPSGCVFVLWGVVAQKLEKRLRAIGAEFNVPVRVVVGPNPAVEEFNKAPNSFAAINAALVEMGLQPIKWLMTRPEWNAMRDAGTAVATAITTTSTTASTRPAATATATATATTTTTTTASPASWAARRRRTRQEMEAESEEEEDQVSAKRRRTAEPPKPSLKDIATEEAGDDEKACVVCLTNKLNTCILDCGHVCACSACVEALKTCPLCRRDIRKVVQIFMA